MILRLGNQFALCLLFTENKFQTFSYCFYNRWLHENYIPKPFNRNRYFRISLISQATLMKMIAIAKVLFFFLIDPGTAWKENFNAFVERSKKLCKAWEVTLWLMSKFQSLMKNKTNLNESKKGAFNDRWNWAWKKSFIQLRLR